MQLVNLNFVTAVNASFAVLENEELQISRAKKTAFLEQLNDFLEGNY